MNANNKNWRNGSMNNIKKLLIVSFAVAVLMLTAGGASANFGSGGYMYYDASGNYLRVEGSMSGYCDPDAGCTDGHAYIELKFYGNNALLYSDSEYNGDPGGDDHTYSAFIRYDHLNPNFATTSYKATLEYWGSLDSVSSYHNFETLTYP